MKFDGAYVWARLKEIGTWRMLAALGGVVGIAVTDGQVEAVFTAFTAAVTAYEAFQPSHKA